MACQHTNVIEAGGGGRVTEQTYIVARITVQPQRNAGSHLAEIFSQEGMLMNNRRGRKRNVTEEELAREKTHVYIIHIHSSAEICKLALINNQH